MPTFIFTSPEGKEYKVNGPEGATREQAWGMLQSSISAPTPMAPQTSEDEPTVPSNEGPEGLAGFAGAIPQTLYNMGVGAAGMVAGGAAGIYKLIESGMDWDKASAAVQTGSDLFNQFRIERSKSGVALEEGIGTAIEGAEDYVAKGLEATGMSPEMARLTAKLSVEGGLAVLPGAPKAIRAVGSGVKGAVRGVGNVVGRGVDALAGSVTAKGVPTIGGDPVVLPKSGGPVARVAGPTLAERVTAAAEARTARVPGVQPEVVPPLAPEGIVPSGAPERPVEAPAVPTPPAPPAVPTPPPVAGSVAGSMTKAQLRARDNTPYFRQNALSNLIDSPMLRAIKVTGGQDNPFVAGLRKLETDTIMGKQQFQNLERTYKTAVDKLVPRDLKQYKAAVLTGDQAAAIEILGRSRAVKGKTNAQALYTEMQGALDTRFKDVVDSGVQQKYVQGYHPRKVIDPEGYAKEFEKMMNEARAKGKHTGASISGIEGMRAAVRKLTDDLRAGTISHDAYVKGLDKQLKSDVARKVFAPKGAHSMQRQVKVVPERLQKFYAEPHQALAEYFNDTSRVLAERRFLGADPTDLEAGVASRIAKDQASGRFSDNQLVEMKKILQDRFNPHASMAPSRINQTAKNIGYMATIGNPLSAAIQVLDILPASARYGLYNTLKGVGQHVLGKMSGNRLDPKKIGLFETMTEIESGKGTVRSLVSSRGILDDLLKISGFRMVDRFGKGTILNAARNKGQGLARSKSGIKKLESKGWKHIHQADWDQFVESLKKGDWNNPNVQEFAIAELLDTQPIALSYLPISALRSPNGRIFYMLKTWAIRQINAVRESYHSGRKWEASKLVGASVMSGMAVPELRDLITYIFGDVKERKEADFSDKLIASMLRMVFLDKYSLSKVGSTGRLGDVVSTQMSIPVLDVIGSVISDAYNGEWDKSKRYIPIVGAIERGLKK